MKNKKKEKYGDLKQQAKLGLGIAHCIAKVYNSMLGVHVPQKEK